MEDAHSCDQRVERVLGLKMTYRMPIDLPRIFAPPRDAAPEVPSEQPITDIPRAITGNRATTKAWRKGGDRKPHLSPSEGIATLRFHRAFVCDADETFSSPGRHHILKLPVNAFQEVQCPTRQAAAILRRADPSRPPSSPMDGFSTSSQGHRAPKRLGTAPAEAAAEMTLTPLRVAATAEGSLLPNHPPLVRDSLGCIAPIAERSGPTTAVYAGPVKHGGIATSDVIGGSTPHARAMDSGS